MRVVVYRWDLPEVPTGDITREFPLFSKLGCASYRERLIGLRKETKQKNIRCRRLRVNDRLFRKLAFVIHGSTTIN
jgi:hypothetical protein